MDINKSIKKQTNKIVQSVVKVGGAKRRMGGRGGAPAAGSSGNKPSGLKISFKPSELGKTTDKNVIQQVNLIFIFISFSF